MPIGRSIVLRRRTKIGKFPQSLTNRAKHFVYAGIGAGALVALAAYRGYHSRGMDVDYKRMGRLSGILGGVLGLSWAVTPPAKEDPSETITGLKQNLYPTVTAMARKAAEAAMEEDRGTSERSERRPYTSSERKEAPPFHSWSANKTKPATSSRNYSSSSREESWNDDDYSFPRRYTV